MEASSTSWIVGADREKSVGFTRDSAKGAAVIGVIGYRVFRAEGSAATADVTALLPKGARVVATAVAEDRLVVTVDTAAGVELHTFDLKTLKPTGRLRFATEP